MSQPKHRAGKWSAVTELRTPNRVPRHKKPTATKRTNP